MKKRKWYRKKRFWTMGVLFFFLLMGQLEFFKLRYQPQQLVANIQAKVDQPVQSQALFVGDRKVAYVQVGQDQDLPNIVLIHGSPGALNAYESYLGDSLLSSQANLVAIDRPGFGYSEFGRTEPSQGEQARLIAGVLKTLPPTPIVLVGHSLGGPVIAKIAMDYPNLADALVMIAPSICPDLEPSNGWRKVVNWLPFRWLTPTALRVCNQEIIPLREELEKMMPGWEKLNLPVTVIQGTEDTLVPVGNADFAEKMLTQSSKLNIRKLEGGDHFILWSEIPLIRQEILQLLDRLQ